MESELELIIQFLPTFMYNFVGLGVCLHVKPFMLMSMQATYGSSGMAALGFLILV